MNTFKKTTLAAAVAATVMASMASSAEAGSFKHHGWGWGGAAAVGLLALGSLAASGAYAEPEYEVVRPRCRLVERVNRYGEVVLRRVCINY